MSFITLDTTVNGDTTSASITQALTVSSNNNRILIVWALTESAVLTSVTYNAVGLTKSDSVAYGSGSGKLELWYLIAPSTGNNNVVLNSGGSQRVRYNIYSYYNAAQSGQPETHSSTAASTDPVTASTTPLTLDATVIGAISVNGVGESTSGNALSTNGITNTLLQTGDTGNLTALTLSTASGTNPSTSNIAAIVATLTWAGKTFSVNDTVTGSETIATNIARTFSILDTSTLSDAITTIRKKTFTILDSFSLTDVFSSYFKWAKSTKNSSSWSDKTLDTSISTNNPKSSSPTWTDNTKN